MIREAWRRKGERLRQRPRLGDRLVSQRCSDAKHKRCAGRTCTCACHTVKITL